MTAPHEAPAPAAAAAIAARLAAEVPALATGRLALRAPEIGDFDAYAEIACSERGAYIGGPMSRDAAWADFTMLVAGWLLRGHGAWTVTPRAGGAPLGFVLIGFEPGDREPELGFLFRAAAEGRGLACEAAAAARDFAFRSLGLASLVSYVDPANSRAIALAERLGARRDPDGPVAALTFRHPRPEPGQ